MVANPRSVFGFVFVLDELFDEMISFKANSNRKIDQKIKYLKILIWIFIFSFI